VTDHYGAGVLAGTQMLDDRLRALDRHCRDVAPELCKPGEALDRDPDLIDAFLEVPAIEFLRQVFTPQRYRAGAGLPVGVQVSGTSCAEWVILMDRLSYADPGVVLASPGPSLSGGAVLTLGDQAQLDWYFGRLAAAPTWTFFGLTEPAKGSAAIELETTLAPHPDGGWVLRGEKRYIGNGARAQVGVVFARRAPGPWGIEAVLVDTADPGLECGLLPTVGLRGARISWLRFDGMRIPPERVLGRDRTPSRRGLHGARQTLLRARPSIAAMALGMAQAVHDYVRAQRPTLGRADRWRLERLADRVAAVRRLVYDVAAEVDRDVVNVHRIGSGKMRAAAVAEDLTLLAADLLGPASLVEHPWLDKAYRDVRAFEFMEGTRNIHRLSVFQGLLKNDFFAR
jgi:alkylation response protein AidB-like acyl-CoA dehydrogenase